MLWDLIVVGGGPAGLQAAIYAASEGMKTLVLEKGRLGGQIGQTPLLENCVVAAGKGISGPEFVQNMREQAEKFGVEIVHDDVDSIGLDGSMLLLRARPGIYVGKAVLLAVGARWQDLTIPGIKTGISRDEVHYGPLNCLYAKCEARQVAVYGGGPSAGQAIMELAERAGHVHALMRSTMRMPQYLETRISGHPKVTVHNYTRINSLRHHNNELTANIETAEDNGHKLASLPLSHLFMCGGLLPNTEWLKGSGVELTDTGKIRTDHGYQTVMPGVFAIGDAREGSVPRVGCAIGEGSTVVSRIWDYFRANELVPA